MTATVTVAYASSLLDYLRAQGLDVHQLFNAAQIALLDGDDGRRLVRLEEWIRMLDDAAATLAQPDLPLRVGAAMTDKHLGVLGYIGRSSPTLADALRQLARYSRLVGNISRAKLEFHGEDVEVVWHWCHEALPPSSMAQVQMAARWRTAQRFTSRPNLMADASFQFPEPADTRAYQQLFGGQCRFSAARTTLRFPAHYLSIPFATGDAIMQQVITRQARDLLDRQTHEHPLIEQLRFALLENLAAGRVGLPEVAATLNCSTRSLQRRLASQHLSYQKILDEVRLTQAERLLEDPHNSLAEVAFLLGYTEQSTFQNAFKRWTGSTPLAWRKAHTL